MATDRIFKCDACIREARVPDYMIAAYAPIGWTNVSVTYSAKREAVAVEGLIGVVADELLDKYRDQFAQMPVPQTAGCHLCDECAPKLAKFFESIGSPLRARDGMIGT